MITLLSRKILIEKCKNQKTISTHLVLAPLEKLQAELQVARDEKKQSQDHYNKHQQLMKTEIQQLKEKNRKLREELART